MERRLLPETLLNKTSMTSIVNYLYDSTLHNPDVSYFIFSLKNDAPSSPENLLVVVILPGNEVLIEHRHLFLLSITLPPEVPEVSG